MIKRELNQRSPLRILENSTHGGLGKGNIGVMAARKGVGKTACLTHIATDRLFRGKQVIHVSFSTDTRHIVDWYKDIFREIARKFDLESAMSVYEEIIKNRIIMNFNQKGVGLARVIKSIRAMIKDGHFSADSIMVDGYDFGASTPAELREIKGFAAKEGLDLWFSVTLPDGQSGTYNDRGIPRLLEQYIEEIDVLICLRPKEKHIHLELVKDHDFPLAADMHLKLDPRTLLIARE